MLDSQTKATSSNFLPSLSELMGEGKSESQTEHQPENPIGRSPAASGNRALHQLQQLEATQAPAQVQQDKALEDLRLSIWTLKNKGFTNQQILTALANASDLPFSLNETRIEELYLAKSQELEASQQSEGTNAIMWAMFFLAALAMLAAMFG